VSLSPNFGPRRDGAAPSLIVLHYTAMPDWRGARDWLCNPKAEVSAHYILSEQGDVVQLVDEKDRAWHAGAGSWGGITDVNSHSIGIELNNDGASPFAAPLMDALETLLGQIMERWGILPHGVIAHSDVAPGRKIDPGGRFDWARLARADLTVAASQTSTQPLPGNGGEKADEATFLRDAAAFGYGVGVGSAVVLGAFRMRHRPGHVGPLDGHDCAIAADLANRFSIAQPVKTS